MKKRTGSSRQGMNTCSRAALSLAILAGAPFAATAHAQTVAAGSDAAAAAGPDAESLAATGDIVVTARRKSENILKTPISIRALTSEELLAKNINTIQDVAQNVPGLNVQQTATTGGRTDRSFSSIQLRGFVPSSSSAQTASIFIDGAPVSVATGLQALTNPERIEVIKGPQSALFGRQTFAGAINVVTKAPSDHLTGLVVLSGGTRANYDVQGEVSAPILKDDVLSVRAGVRAFGRHGSYRNAFLPNETLGDQSSKTGSLAIVFKPTSDLSVKAFGLLTELKDGPAATGLIAAVGTPAGQNLVIAQANCSIRSSAGVVNPFFCGVAPGLSPVAPSANTGTTPAIAALLARTTGRVLAPEQGVHGYGLVNQYYHIHLNADWAIGDSGVTLSSLTAWNAELKSELADLDNYYSSSVAVGTGPEGFYNFPYMIESRARDFSQELRASFENGGPLHAALGGSYLTQRNQSDSGSTLIPLVYGGAALSRTYGLFGSAGYDFSPQFTLSADARYQIDRIYAFAGQAGYRDGATGLLTAAGGRIAAATYKNFTPRIIAQFNVTPRNMIYASYSKGVNPGQFNTIFPASPEPRVRETAALRGYKVAVDPEKITNYEIGAKGRLGIARYDAAAFLAIWTNQLQLQSETVLADGRGPSAAGTPLQVSATVNSGRVRVFGVEANTGFDLASGLTFDVSGAYIRTYILSATNAPVSAFYAIPAAGFRGKENPFVSKYSAAASLAYTRPVTDTLNGFGRVDFTFKSGGYADIANVVRAPDMNQFNLHAGVRAKRFSIEGYVTNLFDNRAYYNVGSTSLLLNGVSTASFASLIAALRELRTVGARATFEF